MSQEGRNHVALLAEADALLDWELQWSNAYAVMLNRLDAKTDGEEMSKQLDKNRDVEILLA